MKYFYYIDNGLQQGPFTIEELKSKRLKKSILVWTDGMQDWATADSINELKKILISEPPPLPKKSNTIKSIKIVQVKQVSDPQKSTKFDPTYKKETDATYVGILLIIIPIILKLTGAITFETIESYNQFRAIAAIVLLILRIAVTVWVVNIATRQNRNTTGWGWLAFFFPSISLIVIGLLKKNRLKIELNGSLTTNEQVAFLLEKANQLFSQDRYTECVEVLNKSIEIDNKNLDCIRLRALSNYQLIKLDRAKNDFEALKNAKMFLSEVYYYLGNIANQNYNRVKAITFWEKAIEHRNEKAQIQLDRYNTFTGKFLLDKSQINKKLASEVMIFWGKCKYLGGFDGINISKKLRAVLKEHENGIEIVLRKDFKPYHFAIAFYEINDIIYDKFDQKLQLLLIGQKKLNFEYSLPDIEFDNEFERFCSRYKDKTGKMPTALSYLND